MLDSDSYDSDSCDCSVIDFKNFEESDKENVRDDIGLYYPDDHLIDLMDFDIYNDPLDNEETCKNWDDDNGFDDDSSREQVQRFFPEQDVSFEDFRLLISIEEIEHGQYLLTMFDVLCEALQHDSETLYERGDFENMSKLQCIQNSNAYWKMALYTNNLYNDYLLPEKSFL